MGIDSQILTTLHDRVMVIRSIKYHSVLYIDSDLDDRELFEEAVGEMDDTIEFASIEGYSSLEETLSTMSEPDLIIVAINRPFEGEILNQYLQHRALSGKPFCILSSTIVKSIIDHAYDIGVNSFLIKPSDYTILKSLLKSVLTRNWSNTVRLKREEFVVMDQFPDVKVTCFMIDDDYEDRAILFNALMEVNPLLPCKSAFDGEDALAQLTGRISMPDLIFLDLNMPRMNGLECLRILRTMRELDRSKIIMFSVSTDPQDVEASMSLGANHFITKPSDHDSLIEVLNGILV